MMGDSIQQKRTQDRYRESYWATDGVKSHWTLKDQHPRDRSKQADGGAREFYTRSRAMNAREV